ncbi:MAG: hypothetical protein ACRDZQ_10580 [Acidimicrobiales bacterium]
MFKRLFWLAVGMGFGFGTSFWVTRALRRTLARWSPAHASAELTAAARQLGADARAALVDGRQVMAAREAALRGNGDVQVVVGATTWTEEARHASSDR